MMDGKGSWHGTVRYGSMVWHLIARRLLVPKSAVIIWMNISVMSSFLPLRAIKYHSFWHHGTVCLGCVTPKTQEACNGGKSLHAPSRIPHHARDGERNGRTQPNSAPVSSTSIYLMPPLVGASGNSPGGWWAKWRKDTIMLRSMFIGCLFFFDFSFSLSIFTREGV